jgi:hypothetical protein
MQVFISHASRDRELAKRLTKELSEEGFHVWNPDDEIYPGDNWAKKFGQALEESELMVVLWTRNAFESAERLERDVQYALTSTSYRGRLLPVLVGFASFKSGEDIPWILLKFDPVYIESETAGFENVIARIRELAKGDCNAAR